MDLQEMNRAVIEEFRANEGKVGGDFEGAPLILVHSVGAKSGQARVNPLIYMQDGDRYVIFASNAGQTSNPPWYYNLRANPDTKVEVGTEIFDVHATEAGEPERTELYDRIASMIPMFADYAKTANRDIPVMILSRR